MFILLEILSFKYNFISEKNGININFLYFKQFLFFWINFFKMLMNLTSILHWVFDFSIWKFNKQISFIFKFFFFPPYVKFWFWRNLKILSVSTLDRFQLMQHELMWFSMGLLGLKNFSAIYKFPACIESALNRIYCIFFKTLFQLCTKNNF